MTSHNFGPSTEIRQSRCTMFDEFQSCCCLSLLLNLPAAFTQPAASILADLCTKVIWKPNFRELGLMITSSVSESSGRGAGPPSPFSEHLTRQAAPLPRVCKSPVVPPMHHYHYFLNNCSREISSILCTCYG